jgi:hypothetical protein
MIHRIKHGIRIGGPYQLSDGNYIFSNADTRKGKRILKKRGYEPHNTLFGPCFRKKMK